MLKIGDFSKLAKVTIKTLRYYDEAGVLKPIHVNSDNGYRYYSLEQMYIIDRIKTFKALGFSLIEIKGLLGIEPGSDEFRDILLGRKTLILKNISEEKSKLSRLSALIKNIEEKSKMCNVTLKQLPEVIVASLRTIISKYNDLHQIAPAMGEKMSGHGAVCAKPEYCFNIYHDTEYKEKDIDVEICEAVVDYCPSQDSIIYKKVNAVKTAACIFHKGAYENLGRSYAELFKWLEENDYEVDGNLRESFIDGCWNKESPDQWLTEIQAPIRKKE